MEDQEGLKVPLVLNNGGQWAIKIDEVIIDGISHSKSLIGIVDSGSSFITLPEKAYQELIKTKFKNLDYCSSDKMPTIVMKIAGHFHSIRQNNYI